jgi:hypothetical protein
MNKRNRPMIWFQLHAAWGAIPDSPSRAGANTLIAPLVAGVPYPLAFAWNCRRVLDCCDNGGMD